MLVNTSTINKRIISHMFNYQTETTADTMGYMKILLGLSMAYFVLLLGGCAVLGRWESHNIW